MDLFKKGCGILTTASALVGALTWGLAGCILNPTTSPEKTRTQILGAREILDSAGSHYNADLLGAYTLGFLITPGSRDLFEYHHKAADEIGIADDEFEESLLFVVDKGTLGLTIDASNFAAHKVRYMPRSFSIPMYGIVDSGTIRVARTGTGRYFVEANVGYEMVYPSGTFGATFSSNRGRLKFKQNFKF